MFGPGWRCHVIPTLFHTYHTTSCQVRSGDKAINRLHSRSNCRGIFKVYLWGVGMDLVTSRDWTFLCHMFRPHDSYPVTPLSLSNPHNTDSTKIIGPGGKTIRQIIEDFELDALDVEDDGRVMISSFNSTRAARCVSTPVISLSCQTLGCRHQPWLMRLTEDLPCYLYA